MPVNHTDWYHKLLKPQDCICRISSRLVSNFTKKFQKTSGFGMWGCHKCQIRASKKKAKNKKQGGSPLYVRSVVATITIAGKFPLLQHAQGRGTCGHIDVQRQKPFDEQPLQKTSWLHVGIPGFERRIRHRK